ILTSLFMFEEEIVIPECFYPEFMFLSILKKERLPGFRIKCGMTSPLTFPKADSLSFPKSFIGNPDQFFISIIKDRFSRSKNINTLFRED
ncbi:MAG: hypothetical protein PHR42_04335, partial [Caldisericia bacterium]|nr:hypothetical protein [Caldisericia bacterium]